MAQGLGHWLNPRTGKWIQVYRHELDIQNERKLKELGVPENYAMQIQSMNPHTQQDEVRILAMQAGLVRLRDNQKTYSIQFYLPRQAVRHALWAIVEFFQQIKSNPWNLTLHNLQYNEVVATTFSELTQKLYKDERVMVNEEFLPPAEDVPYDAELIDKLRKLMGE